ncbi:hypothetical protein CPB85DRAFT_1429968 [Mucidula mucida]|nr:hypothetical protein CPB85DRAFT_1429968 [Mucidula mucida]
MLFAPLPEPYEMRPAVKSTPKPPPTPTSSYVPIRWPSPDPDLKLVEPPPIPAELSNCGFVVYGYRVDDKFALEAGFPNRYYAVLEISDCIEQLRIGDFLSMPGIPAGQELDIFSFAFHRTGGPIWSVGGRGGIPAEKLKELELKMNIKRPAEWINFDEIDKWWED